MEAASVIAEEELCHLTSLAEETVLRAAADISEHELFTLLAARGERRFDRSAQPSDHALFCAHFILFHALYRLRARWRREEKRDLEVSCLRIGVRPWVSVHGVCLIAHDPMSAYYLDIDNLHRTTTEEVRRMLDDFWSFYARSSHRVEALAALGLGADADDVTVKRRYRRLAFECHPDRGGDHEALQKLNAAMEILQR